MNFVKWMAALGSCGLLAGCDPANGSGDAGADRDADVAELDAAADAHEEPDAHEAPDAAEDPDAGEDADAGQAARDAEPQDAGPGDAAVEPPPCTVVAPTSCPDPPPTYADVQPIIAEHCIPCHSPDTPGGPWSLHDYRHVADWQDTIRSNLLACTMPPPDAGMPPLPADESMLILTWLRCDLPR
jgi:hypothetical protein